MGGATLHTIAADSDGFEIPQLGNCAGVLGTGTAKDLATGTAVVAAKEETERVFAGGTGRCFFVRYPFGALHFGSGGVVVSWILILESRWINGEHGFLFWVGSVWVVGYCLGVLVVLAVEQELWKYGSQMGRGYIIIQLESSFCHHSFNGRL